MDFINQVISQYGNILGHLSNIVGIAGFLFGVWRYLRECKIKESLIERERELAHASARLKRFQSFASGVEHYSPKV